MVGKDKPTFHASHHHVTAIMFLLIGIIITRSISFVFQLVLNQNHPAMAKQRRRQNVDFNGNTRRGIDQHLQWAMAAISARPESTVLAHPIRIAAGDWTAGTGALLGNLTMLTLARWEDGRIAEEHLFLESPPGPMMMNQTGDSQ